MTSSVRRTVAALVLGAALATAGCGATTADRAAVVDGSVISETELQTTMREVNGMEPALLQQGLTPAGTLTALIQAPSVLAVLAEKGVAVSDSVARQAAAQRGLADPSEGTLQIVRLATAIGAAQEQGAVTEVEQQAVNDRIAALDVEVNPRYGTYDPNAAAVTLTQPAWITPADAQQ